MGRGGKVDSHCEKVPVDDPYVLAASAELSDD